MIVALFLAVCPGAGADAAAKTAPSPMHVQSTSPTPSYPSPLPTGRVTYRTLSETYNEMERLADSLPERVTRFELPHRSLLGQRVWGLEVSHDVRVSSGKPVFLITGLHHAREWPTVELVMEFVHDVVQHDGTDPVITSLLDRVRLVVVPVVNPDGYDMSRSLLNEQKRKSCRTILGRVPTWAECANPANFDMGVDLNRNYGAFWGGIGTTIGVSGVFARGEAPFSEPETQNIRDLLWSNQVTVALSNHTLGANVLRVPSAIEEPALADLAAYDSLARVVGGELKWPAGPFSDLYYAGGIMEETAYYSAGTFAFAFENVPGQKSFHPPYSFVIDQYFGTGAYPGSSARAGFLRLFAAAADPALHSVLRIKAPAGATLTIRKSFTMETAPVLNADSTSGLALTFPAALVSSVIVPRGVGEVVWHVNPSARPSQRAPELIQETWTLTCTAKKGRSQAVEITVGRGEVVAADMRRCR